MFSATQDPRQREYLAAVSVIWHSGHVDGPNSALNSDESVCTIRSPKGEEKASLLLDFGREIHGGLRFDIPNISSGQPARVRVRFGESISEAMSAPSNDHAIHDSEILVSWMGRTEFGETGFRYARIDLLQEDVEVTVRQICAVLIYRPLEYKGSFESNDLRLNSLWKMGAYTVHLCMQDHVWDGIKRDRLVWIGDLHPEAMVISSVFGAHSIVTETMDIQKLRNPLPQWMNGISSYSLWWIIIQRDWYLYHGDMAYLTSQRHYLLGLIDQLANFIDVDGCEKLDGFRFLEWPTSDDPSAIDAGLQALAVIALRAASELCVAIEENETAVRANNLAEKASKFVRPDSESKQANALKVLAGMADPDNINCSVLSQDPNNGLSTFYGYYILQARAQAGDFQGCLDLIRTYWGGMMDMGATTFWEGFEMSWMENACRIDQFPQPGLGDVHADNGGWCYQGLRHSLCHGWAAGPTAWLSEHVLGVAPASPGFKTVRIQPHLGDLQWVRGTVPTPHGVIEVTHVKTKEGHIDSRVTLPGGVELVD